MIIAQMGGTSTNSTFSYLAAGGEQDVVEFAKTNIYSIKSLFMDLTAFTAGRVLTIRIYYKIDGTTYAKVDEVSYIADTQDVVYISTLENLDHNVKFTMQIDTVEAGNIAVPIRYNIADQS